jgi:hypothetical protein
MRGRANAEPRSQREVNPPSLRGEKFLKKLRILTNEAFDTAPPPRSIPGIIRRPLLYLAKRFELVRRRIGGKTIMRHDTFVLSLIWRETHNSVKSTSVSDLAWVVLGGSALLAYGVGNAVVALRRGSETLRAQQEPWIIVLMAAFALGLAGGVILSKVAWSRAVAPFLKALPLSMSERRRMATVAALSIGAPFVVLAGVVTTSACLLVDRPCAAAWGFGAGMTCAAGVASAVFLHLFVAKNVAPDDTSTPFANAAKSIPLPWLAMFDCAAPAWLGVWACGLPAGAMRLTASLFVTSFLFVLAAALAIGASLARHQAAPAAVAGMIGGLIAFMVSLRCHPLGSPVLRTTPQGFMSIWLRLLRLPLVLSAVCFVAPASAAVIAEPSAWTTPIASGLCLLILNGAYAVFAGYFLNAPLIAALGFFLAVAYAGYEFLEYGDTVIIGFAALIAFLWHKTFQRYRYG